MFKSIFLIFLVAHVLGDFFLQSDKLAQRKQTNFRYILLHSLLYLIVFIVFTLPFWSISLILAAVILSVSHFIIDSCKFVYSIKKKDASMYFIDQAMHIGCIIIATTFYCIYKGAQPSLIPVINNLLTMVIGDSEALLPWIGLILLVLKPANITIKQLTANYGSAVNSIEEKKSVGALIGSLERLIVVLLISVGQYAAIGLILTAKSVARYNKISEDKQFAEYYLLGTLASTLYAVIAYLIVF